MSTTFEYTDSAEGGVDFTSSSVYSLFYNVNTQQLGVEWSESDDLYVYNDVTESQYKSVIHSDSVGREVAALKQSHGPGMNLGDVYTDLTLAEVERSLNVETPRSFRFETESGDATTLNGDGSVTKEYSLQPPIVNTPAPESTKEFSLQPPNSDLDDDDDEDYDEEEVETPTLSDLLDAVGTFLDSVSDAFAEFRESVGLV